MLPTSPFHPTYLDHIPSPRTLLAYPPVMSIETAVSREARANRRGSSRRARRARADLNPRKGQERRKKRHQAPRQRTLTLCQGVRARHRAAVGVFASDVGAAHAPARSKPRAASARSRATAASPVSPSRSNTTCSVTVNLNLTHQPRSPQQPPLCNHQHQGTAATQTSTADGTTSMRTWCQPPTSKHSLKPGLRLVARPSENTERSRFLVGGRFRGTVSCVCLWWCQAVLAIQWLWSLRRLWVAATNRHSDCAAALPLRMNRSIRRLYLICP